MTSEHEKIFFQLHANLPRQAPGSDASTLRLLELSNMPEDSNKALDIGCGPGRSSLLLTKNGFHVTAIDTNDNFLAELHDLSIAQGLLHRITVQNISMFEMPYSDGSFDLIWSEGVAYITVWDNALKSWQKLLKPSGKMVLTECCWLTDNPSFETQSFWGEAYPTMLTIAQATQHANTQGLTVDGTLVLPGIDWWSEYYTPLERRLSSSESTDEITQQVVAIEKKEIELRRKFGSEYGYVGFVLSLKPN